MSCKSEKKTPVWVQDDIDRKVDSLLSKMTLDEKIGQTVLYSSGMDITGPVLDKDYLDYVKAGQVGAIFNATGVAYTKKLQKIAVEETRLGIPLLFGYDVIHGYKTIFPIPMAESCSWDLELIEKTARTVAIEASAVGLHWVYAPMVDIARDPRWGRISEGAGEDTYLGSLIAKARVRGFQGHLNDSTTVLSCVKHYAAYGEAQAGRDYHTVDMSINKLRNVYLPPFKAALDEGAASFMTAFNELNGIPASADSFLLNDILRKEWDFEGFVVTDYTSINEMIPHGYARDLKHAGELAMNAGVDMDMQGGVFKNYMKQSIEEGKVSLERLDNAVKVILRMKYKLGLFDNPYRYCDEEKEEKLILCDEHLGIARDAARKSIVLLKNDKQTLPLSKTSKIALIGPLANDETHILGSWAAHGHKNTAEIISVREGFEKEGINFKYAKGCEVIGGDTSGFSKAIAIAKTSDVAVVVMGEQENMSGEAASRTNIKLPGYQQQLIKEIKKTGKPVVLVLMNGRPLDLTMENSTVDAIVEAWFPGTRGGLAITDVLFGDYNPSAKLVTTFPRSVGQIPIFYNQKNTGRPADIENANPRYVSKYIDEENTPLYPFGFGLSYTTFKYSNTTLDHNILSPDSKIIISATITNTGLFDGEEIVQLYIKDKVASITRPVKELKAFKKVKLKSGQSKTVAFEIDINDLKFYNNRGEFIAEEGAFEFFVAGHSDYEFTHSFYLKINKKTKYKI